jgi:translation initiation factor 4A
MSDAAIVEVKGFSETIETWDDLEISTELLKGIFAYGFETPSPIQKKAIVPLMKGRDVLAQAQSGTGKTATFTIGALANVDVSQSKTQVLVLSPTRELTSQTAAVFESLGAMMTGLRVQAVYGGLDRGSSSATSATSYEGGKNMFVAQSTTPHVLCGCPGRVFDLIRSGKIQPATIRLVILDEADVLLSPGFKDQIYTILHTLDGDRLQLAFFSATMPQELLPMVAQMLRDPVEILVKSEMLTLEGIKQFYVECENDITKYEALKDLFSFLSVSQCIIYCNSVKRVHDLCEAMKREDFPVCCIHSEMEKHQRDHAFREFKNGRSRVLISSDVTARGIDIQQVSIVINFDVPRSVQTYLHRIGRSGRWGRKGVGINFLTPRDHDKLQEIERHYATQIMPLPADLSCIQ